MTNTTEPGARQLRTLAERIWSLPEDKQRELLGKLTERGIDARKLPITAGPRPAAIPLSYAQARLWTIDRMAPGNALYNMTRTLKLNGPLDRRALRGALGTIVQRHETLRTVFSEANGEPIQVVLDAIELPLEECDLTHLPDAVRRESAHSMAERESDAAFDLERGPLFRAKLLCLAHEQHWLVVSMHHIVSDEWSDSVLTDEFVELYSALSSGRVPDLPALPIQYADYALWQRSVVCSAALQADLEYWRAALGDGAYSLVLPTDAPRPTTANFAGGTYSFELLHQLSAELGRVAQRHGVTSFMLALAAYQILLYRYSGQHDIRVGVPIANRNRRETEGLIGFFVNAQVLRTRVSGELTLASYLEQVRSVVAEAQAHQDLPFEQLVDVLQPERRLGQTPLFQVMLSWHREAPASRSQLGDLRVEVEWQPERNAKFDIVLHLTDSPAGLSGQFIYRSELFRPDTMRTMAARFEQLLRSISESPEARLCDLEWLSAMERKQQLEWAGRAERGQRPSVPEWLLEVARARGDALAVRGEDDELSYAELSRQAQRVANWLRAHGVHPGDRVGLCARRGVGFVVGIFGILLAGAAYVPFESKQPPLRLRALLADCRAKLLLCDSELATELDPDALGLPLHSLQQVQRDATGDFVPPCLSPHSSAYVIYTSGSTGKPKGVEVSHAGLQSYVEALLQRLALHQLPAPPSMAMVSTVSADLGNTVLFGALCAGGTLHLLSDARVFDPDAVADYFTQNHVDVLKIVPSHLKGLLQARQPEYVLPRHSLILGGEASPWQLIDKLQSLASCRIINHYGPTETTVGVLTYELDTDAPRPSSSSLPTGRPLPNSRVLLLDPDFKLVPPGVEAELFIGGYGLAHGYLGQPDHTADRFVPDPFPDSPQGGARLYRTGDRARYLPDGVIEFLGRADQQVKLRGYRVELAEIACALRSLDGITDAEVLLCTGHTGNSQLLAYLIGTPLGPDLVQNYLRQRLPEHMVPSDFVWLERFPVTSNGKLDKSALPKPGNRTPDPQKTTILPRNDVERKLASVWCDVLKLTSVGIHDNFFKLGGESLLAFQVIAGARALGVTVTPTEFFEHQTIAAVAAIVLGRDATRTTSAERRHEPIPLADRDAPLPASFAQQRLWFLWQLEPESAAYNVPAALRLTGALDHRALERSFCELIRRHETLRTRFTQTGGIALQLIDPPTPVTIPLTDISELDPIVRDRRLREHLEQEAARPFDLEHGPLLRVRLLRLAEHEHVLCVTQHHIVSDGWSTNVLANEFVALYRAYAADRTPDLEAPTLQYADYAMWQRRWLTGEELERQIEYWRGELGSEHPVLELPADRPRQEVQSYRGAAFDIELDAQLTAELKHLAQAEQATPFMLLLAAFQVVLLRYSGQSKLRVGVPVANRTRPELERLIGFFVNTLVVPCDLAENPPFVELLRRVRGAVLGAQSHQDLPFEQLVEALNPERSLRHSPLFQVMYNHQRLDHTALDQLPGLRVERIDPGQHTTQFDLSLDTLETGACISATWTYASDLFDAGTVTQMAEHWRNLLRSIARNPEQRVERLELFAPGERARVLEGSRAPAAGAVPTTSYVRRFEQRAVEHPERTVACAGSQSLTYGELNRHANRAGHALIASGVRPDDLVAVLGQRDLSLLGSLLGVLKAGSGFLPLDPRHPRERLGEILRLARPRALLASKRLLATATEALSELGEPPKLLCFEDLVEAPLPEHDPGVYAGPRELAYAIYTSGSTGVPKGALVEQQGMLNNQLSKIPYLDIGTDDVLAQTAPQCFDIAVWQLLTAPLAGARVDIVPDDIARDAQALFQYVAARKISVLQCVPSLLDAALRNADLPASRELSLRWLLATGEALSADVARRWFERFPSIPLVNAYGPAECSDDVSLATLREPPQTGQVSIGTPVDRTELYVLDGHLEPVPVGVAGELCVAGIGVGRGYLGDPARTAEAFVPHPHSVRSGERLYRTGDRVRRRHDGALEYLGRADHQVKLRGHRIELGEIEARLGGLPGVANAAVVVHEERYLEKRLVAYVVPDDGEQVFGNDDASSRFREHLSRRLKSLLPDYMVPERYVLLSALPLSENGKLDRRALPSSQEGALRREYAAPENALEHTFSLIWQEVLGLDRVGVRDNFFDLGGDSIVALQMVSRARALGIGITPRDLFQAQDIQALAARAVAAGDHGKLVAFDVGSVTGDVPLTPIQHWFFEQDFEAPQHWNQAVLLEVPEPLTLDALEQSAQWLVRQHDALRLRFEYQANGRVRQWYSEDAAEHLCVRAELGSEAYAAAIERAANRAHRSLNLSTGPLLRLVHLPPAEGPCGRLLVVLHHLIVDSLSWRILLEDLWGAYCAFAAGRQPDPPFKTSSFKRWSEALQAYATSQAVQREAAHWLALATEPESPLPAHCPPEANTVASLATLEGELDAAETTRLLSELPTAYRTQINDVLLTALARAVCRWSDEPSVLVELEAHGREDLFDGVDVSRTVGWFTSAYPVRLAASLDADPPAALRRVKEQLRCVPNNGIGYGVLRYLNRELGAALASLRPRVSFNYLGQFDPTLGRTEELRVASESDGDARAPAGRRSAWLDVDCMVLEGRLRVDWSYSRALHDESEMARVLADFLRELRALIATAATAAASALTPSDFPDVELTQDELDTLFEVE